MQISSSRVGRDKMRHRRIAGPVETAQLLLQQTISLGDAFMLAQMLHPRFDQKSFDHAAFLCCIFEHAPGISAVATPLVLKARQRVKERFTVTGVDVIFHGDQHRAAIVLDRLCG